MKIKILIGVIVVAILCFMFLVIKFFVFDKKNPNELELTYKISAGIPFRWEYEIEDESVVSFVKSYVVKDENKGGIVGAPIYTNYVFKGLKKGETIISFKFVNFTNGKVDRVEKHKVKVLENGNISLVGEK